MKHEFIEIPFGANDSELKGWEYTIPEGYEAEIKDGKVVVREKESKDERIRKDLIESIKIGKRTGITFTDSAAEEYIAWLEKQKEQKPAEKYFDLTKILVPPQLPQNLTNGDSEKPNNQWSEEDEDVYKRVYSLFEHGIDEWYKAVFAGCFPKITREKVLAMLKSLRPQPKEENKEPMEIKFANKIYRVYGTKELPGGVIGYIIEDEPGHYDCITNPEEILGGCYGIKENGKPYPTKSVAFSQSHWKPSEQEKGAIRTAIHVLTEERNFPKAAAQLQNILDAFEGKNK